MNTRWKIAFVCHLLAIAIMAVFGLIYLLRPEFMPYHSVAIGLTWEEVSPPFRVLILALMKAVGSSALSLAFLETVLLFIPFRKGATWARWAIPGGGLLYSLGALYVMLYVDLDTPASPPWIAPVAGIALFVAGFVFSADYHRKKKEK